MPTHKDGHAHLIQHKNANGALFIPGHHLSGRRPDDGRRRPRSLAALALIVVAAIAAITVVVILTVPRHDHSNVGIRSTPPAAVLPSAHPSHATEIRQRCRSAWLAMHRAVVAAEPAMDQWRRHITVMNRFVAGQLTLAQANAFWAETRVQALRRYDRFAARARSVATAVGATACPKPPAAGSPPAASSASSAAVSVTTCERAVAAEAATLDAARITLSRWRRHIVAMDQLRAGMLNPAMAQQMWLATWHAGVAQVRAFDNAARRSAAYRCAG